MASFIFTVLAGVCRRCLVLRLLPLARPPDYEASPADVLLRAAPPVIVDVTRILVLLAIPSYFVQRDAHDFDIGFEVL